MKTNVGLYDQAGRVLLAIAIAALYYFKVVEATTAQVLLILAGLLVLTSYLVFALCTNYFILILHIRTAIHDRWLVIEKIRGCHRSSLFAR